MKTYHDIATDGGSDILGQVTAQHARLRARMADVGRVVAVMSGKGGVGKSTVTMGLAAALALDGAAVGLVDADVNGPSLAKMAGARGQPLQAGPDGIRPAVGALGLKVMSMDLFLPDDRTPVVWDAPTQRDAFTWRGTLEAVALREFLADTAWGRLDYLLLDLPPGADKLPNLVDLLPELAGVVVVTIPTEVSALVVGRSVEMATARLGAPVLGVVQNMTAYVCPCCGEASPLFPPADPATPDASFGLPVLARLPFDPRMARCADRGEAFPEAHPEAPAARAFQALARSLPAVLAAASSSDPSEVLP